MATLMIYRGDTLDREVELGDGIVRIGRSRDSDIVLDDPTFTVSRNHAELRFEQNGYSLTDKKSENGVWVAGKRVATTMLAPGVPVVLGCYKVVLKAEQPALSSGGETVLFRPVAPAADVTVLLAKPIIEAQPAPVKPTPAADVKPAISVPPPTPPPGSADASKNAATPVPLPSAMPASPAQAAAPAIAPIPPPQQAPEKPPVAPVPAPRVTPSEAPPAPVLSKPQPVASAKATDPAAPVKPKDRRTGKAVPKSVVFGGIAVVLVAGIAAVVFRMPFMRRPVPVEATKPAPPVAMPPVAEVPAAVTVPPATPPLASDVTSPSVAPAPVDVPAPEAPSPLSAAPAPSAPRQAAPQPSKPKVAPQPSKPPQAKPPLVKSTIVAAPAAPVAPVVAKPKPVDLATMFEAARSAMIKEDYLTAIAGFEAVLKISPDYPNAANLLGVAHGGATNAAHLAVEDAGNKAEMSGDYAEAAKQYDRALQLDPSSREAADAMRRLKLRMQREGQDALKRGQASEAAGKTVDAIASYQKAVQLLPPDDSAAKTAAERLAALKAKN